MDGRLDCGQYCFVCSVRNICRPSQAIFNCRENVSNRRLSMVGAIFEAYFPCLRSRHSLQWLSTRYIYVHDYDVLDNINNIWFGDIPRHRALRCDCAIYSGIVWLWSSAGEQWALDAYWSTTTSVQPLFGSTRSSSNTISIAICIAATDILFSLVFGNVQLVSAIVRCQMEELTALLRVKCPRSSGDVKTIKRHFMHFIGVHQKYNE